MSSEVSADQARDLLIKGREFQQSNDFEMAWAYYEQAIKAFSRLSMDKELVEAQRIAYGCREQALLSRTSRRPTSVQPSNSNNNQPTTVRSHSSRSVSIPVVNDQSQPTKVSSASTSASTSTQTQTQTQTQNVTPVPAAFVYTTSPPPVFVDSAENQVQSSALRPWLTEFFNTSQFSIPRTQDSAFNRIAKNLKYFRINYFGILLLVFLYYIFTSSILFWIAFFAFGFFVLLKSEKMVSLPYQRTLRAKYESIDPKYRVPIVLLLGFFIIYIVFESLSPIVLAFGTSFFIVLVHGVLHEVPRIQNNDPLNCIVCLTNKNDAVLIPCGHTCCITCAENIRNKLCPTCGASFDTVNRIYI